MLTGLFALILIVSLVMLFTGLLAAQIFFRYILPILVVILIIRIIIAGVLLLFNPHFWLAIIVIALIIWLAGKLGGRRKY